MGTGTYTGVIFSMNVPAATPLDFYGFQFTSGLSQLRLQARNLTNDTTSSANQAFSVLVANDRATVPESGSTVLLLGSAMAALMIMYQRSSASKTTKT
jgi:hypothetical protein